MDFLGFVALTLVGGLLVVGRATFASWPFSAYSEPSLVAVVGVVFAAGLLVWARSPAGKQAPRPAATFLTLVLPTVLGMAVLVFLPFARIEDPPLGAGDSLHLLTVIPVFTQLFGFLGTPDELLELVVRSFIYAGGRAHLPAAVLIGLYSYAAGAVLLAAVAWFLRREAPGRRVIGWLVLFFTPRMALFAGYIESYSMASALVTAILLIGWRTLENPDEGRQRKGILALAVLSATGVLHHLLVGLMLPALVFLVVRASHGSLRVFLRHAAVGGLAALSIIGAGYGVFLLLPDAHHVFGESHIGNPAILSLSTALSARSLARPGSLLLLEPLPLGFLLVSLVRRLVLLWRGETEPAVQAPSVNHFLWIAAASFMTHAILWKSTIGFPADWDLFSTFLLPLHVLVLRSLFQESDSVDTHRVWRWSGALGLAALTVFPGLLWLGWWHKQTPETVANLSYTASVQKALIPSLNADPVFLGLPRTRRTAYVRVTLFADRVRFLDSHVDMHPSEREELKMLVDRGLGRFRGALHAPDAEYNAAFATAQQDFYRAYQLLRGRAVHP